jgi:hypothetical protein
MLPRADHPNGAIDAGRTIESCAEQFPSVSLPNHLYHGRYGYTGPRRWATGLSRCPSKTSDHERGSDSTWSPAKAMRETAQALLIALVVLGYRGPGDCAGDEQPARRVGDPKLQEEINGAIDRGVRYVSQCQMPDGAWYYEVEGMRGGPRRPPDGTGGLTALAIYALAASGVPERDPSIARGLAWERAHPIPFSADSRFATYSVSLLAMALCRLSSATHEQEINILAQRIEDGAVPHGGWTYDLLPRKRRAKQERRIRKAGGDPVRGDISNTQFAVLALWAAEALGSHTVRRSTWQGLRKTLSELQGSGGDWPYGMYRKGARGHADEFTRTRTAAGLLAFVCADAGARGGVTHLSEARTSDDARRGLLALRRGGNYNYGDYFFDYCVERTETLLDRPTREWYPQGARALVEGQAEDGHWGPAEHGDSRHVYETALALLFLSRATSATVTPR